MICHLPASIQHIWHESCRCSGSRRIDYIRYYRGQRRCYGISDDGTRGWPCKNFDLPWCIQDNVAAHSYHETIVKLNISEVSHSTVSALFSTRPRTWSNLVVNRFSAVRMPPFGPRLYLEFVNCYLYYKEVSRTHTASWPLDNWRYPGYLCWPRMEHV